MTVEQIKMIIAGFETYDGLKVCDVRLESQVIILDECNQDTNEFYTTEFNSKLELLAYMFSCHMNSVAKAYQKQQLQKLMKRHLTE